MVKQGPCYHCGVTSTPLWRNGPPEKPVLCNACGSRWRTKGTLANYTPIHARTETDDIDDKRFSRVKCISLNKNKEVKKRKLNEDNLFTGVASLDYNQGCRKATDEDISNRSSSGSAISNSESCAQFGGTDASDLTGPAQSVIWDGMVPSKKRTCIVRPKQSAVEKLTKELHSILQEHPSYFSTSSEDDLIFESETPMVSVEIGHGSILMKHPSWIAREEESEASSFSVDNKQCLTCEVYSCSGTANGHNSYSSANFPSQGVQKIRNSAGQGMLQDQFKRNKTQHDKIHALGKKSPLCSVDLNDVINYNEFTRTFTNEEQRQLLQYLTAVDTIKLPDSLESMFSSSQFRENLNYFQQLLAEGVFDLSLSGIRPEDRKTLQQLVVSNLSKSQWVEYYNSLKKHKNRAGKSIAVGSSGTASSSAANPKRYHDSKSKSLSDLKTTMRSPERVMMKVGCKGKEAEEYGSGFSPKNLFTLPSDGDSLMLDSFNFVGESGDQDLLLDVPSNGSFPEAELLHPNLSLGTQASTSSSSKYHNTGHP